MAIGPSRADFRAWAQHYTVLPVWRELVADLTTPVAAFARRVRDLFEQAFENYPDNAAD